MEFLDTVLSYVGLERRSNSRLPNQQAESQSDTSAEVTPSQTIESVDPTYPFAERRLKQSAPGAAMPGAGDQNVVPNAQLSIRSTKEVERPSRATIQEIAAVSESVRRSLAMRRQERAQHTNSQGHAGG